MNLQKLNVRTFILLGLLLAVLAGFGITLLNVQLVHGKEYEVLGNLSSAQQPIPAARGVILDRSGFPLVVNESTLSIVFEWPFFPSRDEMEQRNHVLASLIALFEENGAQWIDTLPIGLDKKGEAFFLPGRERDIAQLKGADFLKLNDYATAENCLDALIEMYRLQEYDIPTARKLASVQYNMLRLDYGRGTPYTFATDVTDVLKSRVKENSVLYRGVQAVIVPVRRYTDGTLAPHVVGRVAAINPEDYQAHREDEIPYKITDEFGASGIERAAEAYLRGRTGLKTVSLNTETGEASETIDRAAAQGDTVILTIDSGLQKLIEENFPKHLYELRERRFAEIPPAGAVVVMDVRSGEILACVSYPGYDISTYSQNLAALNSDANGPLWNRALRSTYEPGSTIKVSVALAALQEGIINEHWTLRCTGTYPYRDMVFHCPQVYLHRGTPVNAARALVDSCNSFFYDMGRQLEYEKINAYRLAMGLGQKTGVELPEASGVMESPEQHNTAANPWYPGYNLQTAIGQGNLFTPIQMAVYTSTIANGGTRYQARLIQSIRKAGTNELVKAFPPIVLGATGVDKAHYDTVRRAMLELGSGRPNNSPGKYFRDLSVKVCAKTGTSQVRRMVNGRMMDVTNGIFISFAPYDNPEIAVVAIGEGCKTSEPLVPTVADIYRYYFGSLNQMETPQEENVLLG